jgi:hypothetical protein
MIDELQALVESHERISLNLALMGGLKSLLTYVFDHPDGEARKLACSTFSQVVSNNPQLQEMASKLEAI